MANNSVFAHVVDYYMKSLLHEMTLDRPIECFDRRVQCFLATLQ